MPRIFFVFFPIFCPTRNNPFNQRRVNIISGDIMFINIKKCNLNDCTRHHDTGASRPVISSDAPKTKGDHLRKYLSSNVNNMVNSAILSDIPATSWLVLHRKCHIYVRNRSRWLQRLIWIHALRV